MVLQDLVARLEEQNDRAVLGVMLDVYPRDIAALAELGTLSRIDMSASWYFDGERRLRLR